MAKLKIVWHSTAYNRYSSIIAWYVMNCGNSFAKTFIEDVDKKLELLSFMPTLGKTKRVVGKKSMQSSFHIRKLKLDIGMMRMRFIS